MRINPRGKKHPAYSNSHFIRRTSISHVVGHMRYRTTASGKVYSCFNFHFLSITILIPLRYSMTAAYGEYKRYHRRTKKKNSHQYLVWVVASDRLTCLYLTPDFMFLVIFFWCDISAIKMSFQLSLQKSHQFTYLKKITCKADFYTRMICTRWAKENK